ncbi:MAG TPA: tetratricopeptide repeat protein, partial [Gemmataceae bacterium]|nr:tetratricopeptide repeat protein [Gemmataceae bacterium]
IHKTQARDGKDHVIAESQAEVVIAIGAGRRGYSFAIETDGRLTQSPISWIADRKGWDLSPHLGKSIDQLYRPIQVQCLFCHVNRVEPVPDSGNRYSQPISKVESIGCERCHGPGALHVQRWATSASTGDADETIVNPRRLEPKLREAVCQQCHLQGVCRIAQLGKEPFDFRPGLPLQDFIAIYVWPRAVTDHLRFSSQVEQMQSSRCFVGSKEELGCISCHDPHELPEPKKRADHFRSRCLTCHEVTSCGLPMPERRTVADSCIDCHMPRLNLSNMAHMTGTDHRILRRRDHHEPEPPPSGTSDDILVSFYSDPATDANPGSKRNMALALMDLASNPLSHSRRQQMAHKALPFLNEALNSNPEDPDAWQAKGYALWMTQRPEEALAVFEAALKLAPERWLTLQYAGSVAAQLGFFDVAVDYWQRAAKANPLSARSHAELGRLWMSRKLWTQAEEECAAALRLDAFHLGARKTQVECHFRQGKHEAAGQEFKTLLALHPQMEQELRSWFKELGKADTSQGP